MMKKYELTDKTIEIDGHVLHQILAVRDNYYGKEGYIGGYFCILPLL